MSTLPLGQGQTDVAQADDGDLGGVGMNFVKKLGLHRVLWLRWDPQPKEKIGGQTAQIVYARPIRRHRKESLTHFPFPTKKLSPTVTIHFPPPQPPNLGGICPRPPPELGAGGQR